MECKLPRMYPDPDPGLKVPPEQEQKANAIFRASKIWKNPYLMVLGFIPPPSSSFWKGQPGRERTAHLVSEYTDLNFFIVRHKLTSLRKRMA